MNQEMCEMCEDPTFESELQKLINRYSLENRSNTPDFILAKYLKTCLDAFSFAVDDRENWYGRNKTSSFIEREQIEGM